MPQLLSSSLDDRVISEILSEIENYIYSDELLQRKWFSYYEELFIDISQAAEDMYYQLANLRRQVPAQNGHGDSDFDIAAMLLNYNSMDYLIAADSGMSEDADHYAQDNMEALAQCSKQDQRQLIISVFGFMVEFQRLKVMYKTLVTLLEEFDNHNSDMDEFFCGGAE